MQHILIVEDDLDIQDLLRNFLQEVGYEITIASDGMEAIALFSSAHFDLILLDIMLPKIDGFTVCELIRKQSQVPIIMLTALNGEEEQIRGLDLQVDDYMKSICKNICNHFFADQYLLCSDIYRYFMARSQNIQHNT